MPVSTPAGVLVVRAWVDADHVLRARITYSRNLTAAEQVVVAVAGPEAVYSAVREWLEAVQSPQETQPPP